MNTDSALWSPYVVPLAGTIMILGIVAVNRFGDYSTRKLQFEERMAAIAKGLPMPEMSLPPSREKRVDLRLRMANVRLGGILTTAGGVAALLFFCVLSFILRDRDVLAGAAAALVPIAIGVGLLIDAAAQAREIALSPTPFAPSSFADPYPPQ